MQHFKQNRFQTALRSGIRLPIDLLVRFYEFTEKGTKCHPITAYRFGEVFAKDVQIMRKEECDCSQRRAKTLAYSFRNETL